MEKDSDYGMFAGYQIVGVTSDRFEVRIDGEIVHVSTSVHKSTFRHLGGDFYCDRKKLFRGTYSILGKHVAEIDLATVRIAGSHDITVYVVDAKGVFLSGYIGFGRIEGADPDTFEVVDAAKFFSKDAKRHYYCFAPMPCAPHEGRFLNDCYMAYGNDVYWTYTERIIGADATTFRVVEANDRLQNVGVDVRHVYYRGMPVPDADPSTFEVLPGCTDPERNDVEHWNTGRQDFVRDASRLWFVNTHEPSLGAFQQLEVPNPADFDFVVVNQSGYATDGKVWFKRARKVKAPPTFPDLGKN